MIMQKISDRIYSVGVNDDDKVLFEGLWPLPYGVSYNSYVVADEKVALIDTVEGGFEDDFLDNINEAIGDRPIDYLIVNHMEPDHSSLTSYMMERYPKLSIVANAKTVPMLKGYYNVPDDRILVIKEGDSLSLGGSTLSFHMVPMVHWPETMVTWLAEENTVFSGDAFGTFGTVADDIVDTGDTLEQYRDEMIRYYSNIVGKYGIGYTPITLSPYCIPIYTFMIFPLFQYSLEQLMEKGKCKLYIILLAYMLISNFYLTFMVCLYTFAYYMFHIIGIIQV